MFCFFLNFYIYHLGKYSKASVSMPGGCDFGVRPIDQHLKGFQALGADYTVEHGMIQINSDCMIGNQISFDKVTVGATINVMFCSILLLFWALVYPSSPPRPEVAAIWYP